MSKIISVNAGSSSLKFQLFEMDDETIITSGVIERIGLEDSILLLSIMEKKMSQLYQSKTIKLLFNFY